MGKITLPTTDLKFSTLATFFERPTTAIKFSEYYAKFKDPFPQNNASPLSASMFRGRAVWLYNDTSFLPWTATTPTGANSNRWGCTYEELLTQHKNRGTDIWIEDTANWDVLNTSTVQTEPQGVQIWRVPVTGKYKFTARGASGGQSGSLLGGFGGEVWATYPLGKDTLVYFVIGKSGQDTAGAGAGGGGATWVFFGGLSGASRAIIAAGGGGAAGFVAGANQDANTSNAGKNGSGGTNAGGTGGTSYASGGAGSSGSLGLGGQAATAGGSNGTGGSGGSGADAYSYGGGGGCGSSGFFNQNSRFQGGGHGSSNPGGLGGFGGGGSGGFSGTPGPGGGGGGGGSSGGGGGARLSSTETGLSGAGGGGGSVALNAPSWNGTAVSSLQSYGYGVSTTRGHGSLLIEYIP